MSDGDDNAQSPDSLCKRLSLLICGICWLRDFCRRWLWLRRRRFSLVSLVSLADALWSFSPSMLFYYVFFLFFFFLFKRYRFSFYYNRFCWRTDVGPPNWLRPFLCLCLGLVLVVVVVDQDFLSFSLPSVLCRLRSFDCSEARRRFISLFSSSSTVTTFSLFPTFFFHSCFASFFFFIFFCCASDSHKKWWSVAPPLWILDNPNKRK